MRSIIPFTEDRYHEVFRYPERFVLVLYHILYDNCGHYRQRLFKNITQEYQMIELLLFLISGQSFDSKNQYDKFINLGIVKYFMAWFTPGLRDMCIFYDLNPFKVLPKSNITFFYDTVLSVVAEVGQSIGNIW